MGKFRYFFIRGIQGKNNRIIWAYFFGPDNTLVIMTLLFDSIYVANLGTAILASAVIGLLNALLWPLLSYIVLPFAVLTLGIAALVMNALIVWLATAFVPGFSVDGFWAALLLALGLTAITTILSSLLTIDDDNSWQRNVLRRRVRRQWRRS